MFILKVIVFFYNFQKNTIIIKMVNFKIIWICFVINFFIEYLNWIFQFLVFYIIYLPLLKLIYFSLVPKAIMNNNDFSLFKTLIYHDISILYCFQIHLFSLCRFILINIISLMNLYFFRINVIIIVKFYFLYWKLLALKNNFIMSHCLLKKHD